MGRAVWVWDEPAPAALAAWCARQGVTELFVAVPTRLSSSPRLAWLQELRRRTTPGVAVQLLGGDPRWVDEPEEARRWWQEAIDAGQAHTLHLDVEVWAHDDWHGPRRAELVRCFEGLLAEAAGLPVRVEADLAFHLHQVRTGTGGRLDEAVLQHLDAVTLLSYRRRVAGPDGLLDVARPTVEAARRADRPVRLAVTCTPLPDDPDADKQTFHGRTEGEMLAALDAVERALGGLRRWAGTAVHDRAGWAALRR